MTTQPPFAITARQTDVLRLIAQGFSTLQMAQQMGVSVNTVESHRKHLYRKLGVKRVGEVIRVAQEWGLLGV